MMRSFLVRSGEEIDILPAVESPITGKMSQAVRYYNGTAKGIHLAIGINEGELFIAHVTARGASEIDAMEEPEGYADDQN